MFPEFILVTSCFVALNGGKSLRRRSGVRTNIILHRSHDIKEERDKLLDIIKEFQVKRKAYSGIEETDITACGWTKVLKLVQSMEKHYEKEQMTGQYGSLRKCLYKVGENGDCFKKWLDLLSDGDYGSVVSGSFKLIVEVRATYSPPKPQLLNFSRPQAKFPVLGNVFSTPWQISRRQLQMQNCILTYTGSIRPIG